MLFVIVQIAYIYKQIYINGMPKKGLKIINFQVFSNYNLLPILNWTFINFLPLFSSEKKLTYNTNYIVVHKNETQPKHKLYRFINRPTRLANPSSKFDKHNNFGNQKVAFYLLACLRIYTYIHILMLPHRHIITM